MTVITGFSWLSEVVMIADTRVSWITQQGVILKTEDVLKKLYSIRSPKSPQKAAVLGFSANDIRAAKTVITHLGKHKFQNYNRPLVMVNLKDDLRSWMEEVTVTRLTREARANLKFMLCGIERGRPLRLKKGDKIVSYPQILETHLYVYSIDKESGEVKVSVNQQDFAAIGSGRKLKKEMRKQVHQGIKFGFNQPKLYPARAFLITDIISSMFEADESIKDVGGPFQTVRITPTGLIQDFVWWPRSDDKSTNIEVKEQGGKTVIYNPALKKNYTLYPVWELPF